MDRLERTELFGEHVICATASRSSRPGLGGHWEIRVSAMELGSRPDAPLLQFPIGLQDQEDPTIAIADALRDARLHLIGAARKKEYVRTPRPIGAPAPTARSGPPAFAERPQAEDVNRFAW
jgi:hypothetical protein